MRLKEIGLLALLLFVPFGFYFFTPYIFGTDTFLYLSNICNGTPLPADSPATQFVFSLLPCNFVVLKLLLYFLALVCLLGVAQTGNLLYKNGWLAALFVFLNPLFVFGMAQLENENFAMPFLFWANYFALKAKLTQHWERIGNAFVALVLVGYGALFWNGAAYYVAAFGLLALPFVPTAIASILFYGRQMWDNLMPKAGMYEAIFGIGVIFLGVNIFTLVGLFLNSNIMLISIFWIVVLVLMGKFAINAVPWIAIATLALYNEKRFEKFDAMTKKPFWKTFKQILIMTAIIMPLAYGYSITFFQPPQTEDVAMVKEFVSLQQQGYDCKNDFSYGYWIQFFGGKPTAVGGFGTDQNYSSGIILTPEDLNCTILKEHLQLKLYDCH